MLTLNSKQRSTLDDFIQAFIHAKKNEQSLLYQINGPAGTGKTELTRHFIDRLSNEYAIRVCAPTHKACQVLQERLREYLVPIVTCHQFLDAKSVYNTKGESKWKFNTEIVDIPDLLILDEVSMVSQEVYEQFKFLLETRRACILTLGDRCQLPPVLEEESRFYTQHVVQSTLTRNMRNDHKVYNRLLNRLRYFIEHPEQIPSFTINQLTQWLSEYTQVYELQTEKIDLKRIPQEIIEILAKNDEQTVLLAHRTNSRNNTVQQLNQYLRSCIFGQRAQDTFTLNERVLFTDFYTTQDGIRLYTNDRAIITEVCDGEEKFYDRTFKVYKLVLEYQKSRVKVNFIHNEDQAHFEEYSKHIYKGIQDNVDRLEAYCKMNCLSGKRLCRDHRKEVNELWKTFHESKKHVCCPIDYAYCLSIHKSQGSTYDHVYLFLSDFIWMKKTQPVEFFKLLYVGMSRAKNTTVVF